MQPALEVIAEELDRTGRPVPEIKGSRSVDGRVVGSVKAPDAEMALVLARETHFRHKEGVAYAVRRRGEAQLHVSTYDADATGGTVPGIPSPASCRDTRR
jgi:hypothetical protein